MLAACGYANLSMKRSQNVFQRQYETNVLGTVKVTRSVLPWFRQRRAGVIVMIGSINGVAGIAGGSPYCSSKFALEGMSWHDAMLSLPQAHGRNAQA